jgi:hypothetical protein
MATTEFLDYLFQYFDEVRSDSRDQQVVNLLQEIPEPDTEGLEEIGQKIVALFEDPMSSNSLEAIYSLLYSGWDEMYDENSLEVAVVTMGLE